MASFEDLLMQTMPFAGALNFYNVRRAETLEASRASILFVDETQVKLNAGAVLTIRQVRTPGGPASSMELQRGEAWFRTKNPRSGLTIQTPAAAAGIRGTEINVRVRNTGDHETTVHWHGLRLDNPYDGVPHETQPPIPVGGGQVTEEPNASPVSGPGPDTGTNAGAGSAAGNPD